MKQSIALSFALMAAGLVLAGSLAQCADSQANQNLGENAISWPEEKIDLPRGATVRIGTGRLCPRVPVKLLQFVGKEQFLLSAGDAGNEVDHALIQVWNPRDGSEKARIRLPCNEVMQLRAASSANVVLVQVNSDEVLVYDAKSASQLGTVRSAHTFSAFAIAPDGKCMLSVENNMVVLRRIPAGDVVGKIKLEGREKIAHSVAISSDQKRAAVLLGTNVLSLDLSYPRITLLRSFVYEDRYFGHLIPDHDRVLAIERAAVCNLDGEIIARADVPDSQSKTVLAVGTSTDGFTYSRSVWGGQDICLTDRSGRRITAFSVRQSVGTNPISAISHESRLIAFANRQLPIQLFQVDKGVVKRLGADAINIAGNAIFDEVNGNVIGRGGTDTVWEWSLKDGRAVRELHSKPAYSFKFVCYSDLLAIRGLSLYVGNPSTDKPKWRPLLTPASVFMGSSDCGRYYLTSRGDALAVERLDGDRADSDLSQSRPWQLNGLVERVVPSISARYATVTVDNGTIYKVDYEAIETPVALADRFGPKRDIQTPVAYWPSLNRLVYLARDNYLRSKCLRSGNVYFDQKLTGELTTRLVAPSGNYLALSEGDHCVIRDAYSGTEVWRTPASVPYQRPVCFTRDSCRLLTCNANGVGYVWDWTVELGRDRKPEERVADADLVLQFYSDDAIEASIAMRELCSPKSTVDFAAAFPSANEEDDILKVVETIGRADSVGIRKAIHRLETCSASDLEKLRNESRTAKTAESRNSIEEAIRRIEASRGTQRLIHALSVRSVQSPLRRLADSDRNAFAALLSKDAIDRISSLAEGKAKWSDARAK